MGQICGKLRCLLCCWCCCPCNGATQTPTSAQFKLLLLGASGSGKTQLGHQLSGRQRAADDVDATNGVRCYRVAAETSAAASSLLLTEVGGSVDMQRIWPHYYASCHALLYCFDLSASNDALLASFELLQRCLQHAALRGKPVLLVATRHRDGVQLYDVEHSFGLEQLTRDCGSPLHMCQLSEADLSRGLAWLRRQLHCQAAALAQRIRYDVNMQTWQQRRRTLLSSGKLAQVRRQRFHRRHRKLWPLPQSADVTQARPSTAPAAIFFVRTQSSAATS